MARKTILVSDLSGATIDEGKGAMIRISFHDQRRGHYQIDCTAEEAAELVRRGARKVARRGRRPSHEGPGLSGESRRDHLDA